MANSDPSSKYLYAVNGWSTPNNTWLQDIEQSARIGARAIGLWEGKFADGDVSTIAAALERNNIRAGIVMPHRWTILPTPLDPGGYVDWTVKCEAIRKSIPRLAQLNPIGVMIGPGVSGDPNRRLPPDHVAEGLAIVADAAADYGLRIAFEPLALRRGAAVSTMSETVALLDTVGRPNIEILLDVFHSWPEPDLHASLRAHVHRIMAVQVNDIRFKERSWCDRVFPGEEKNICTPIVATLIEAGFQGWYDFELFSDDGRWGNAFPDSYWLMPHEEFLRRGSQAFERCFDAAQQMVAAGKLPQ